MATASDLHEEIKACTLCKDHLPLGPRPVVQFSSHSRILIIGQAPGTRVHESGVPWNDDSGERLRSWLGLEPEQFYDPALVALMPMGFCYPGKAKGGDAPPRKECAPAWHQRMLDLLPKDRLTLLVGSYAQARYLPEARKLSLTDKVRQAAQDFDSFAPFLPLPHPSWRVRKWIGKNSWYEADLLPRLRSEVAKRLTAHA
ncbi:MAG: uracil-DNA glycosylase family protein [Pseudomonadota bacterium]